jgi:hypothetical protein
VRSCGAYLQFYLSSLQYYRESWWLQLASLAPSFTWKALNLLYCGHYWRQGWEILLMKNPIKFLNNIRGDSAAFSTGKLRGRKDEFQYRPKPGRLLYMHKWCTVVEEDRSIVWSTKYVPNTLHLFAFTYVTQSAPYNKFIQECFYNQTLHNPTVPFLVGHICLHNSTRIKSVQFLNSRTETLW